ncbi:MAG: peptidylprolyl isomerase [Myxococcota bacterium]
MLDSANRPGRPAEHRSARAALGRAAIALGVAACAFAVGCGIESRRDRQAGAEAAPGEAAAAPAETRPFEWPRSDQPRPVVVLELKDRGDIRIALYPELAPRSVEAFRSLASVGFYDGTTFHRVIPEFMIQGGDPNTRDDDPRNDGQGGPDFRVPDEFSDALHTRGTVSLANKSQPNTSGSQFFIVQRNQPGLDGHYNVIGRVVDGMDIVDDIAQVETDLHGRWGPANRPIEDVVIEGVRFEEMDDGELHAAR